MPIEFSDAQRRAEAFIAKVSGKRETEKKRSEQRLVDRVGKDASRQGANRDVAEAVSNAKLPKTTSKRKYEQSMEEIAGTGKGPQRGGKKTK